MVTQIGEQVLKTHSQDVVRKQSFPDYRIGPPDDRLIFTDRDCNDVQVPARGSASQIDERVYRLLPRTLKQLIDDTLEDLRTSADMFGKAMALADFKAEINSIVGLLTSYPPIPIYRFSDAELRAAQRELLADANHCGPCNPEANARMMLYQAIDEALRERHKKPRHPDPGIILL